jgi:hypothetical protein
VVARRIVLLIAKMIGHLGGQAELKEVKRHPEWL